MMFLKIDLIMERELVLLKKTLTFYYCFYKYQFVEAGAAF